MSSANLVKIIIPEVDVTAWMGGKLYYENLKKTVEEFFPNISFVTYDARFKPGVETGIKARIARKIKGVNYIDALHQNAKEYFNGLTGNCKSVIFSNHSITYTGGVPYLFWIPDFQFLHLPEFAEPEYIERQKKLASSGAAQATAVLLSSNDARQDFLNFVPEYSNKARVVSFVKSIDKRYLQNSPELVAKKYHLPNSFFYVPNQFWKHKNHLLVLKALVVLKQQGVVPFVVFSGNCNDFRNPDYFSELLNYTNTNGIREQVAFLGMIPYEDVIALIRQSVAVINPSLFEGWSTTVEEVKSRGKRMLLSDLSVHREQFSDNDAFFAVSDPAELAEKMKTFLSLVPGPDQERENMAEVATVSRRRIFAEQFVAIINDLIAL
jgi:glycosyltransferase involved in cell wall biosynthesis